MVYIPVHVSAVILLQIVMVGPGTHLVKNHKSLSITNESQLKKKTRIPKLKMLGLFCWRQTSSAARWLFYKCGQGFELRTTKNKFSQQTGWELYSEPSDYNSSGLTA